MPSISIPTYGNHCNVSERQQPQRNAYIFALTANEGCNIATGGGRTAYWLNMYRRKTGHHTKGIVMSFTELQERSRKEADVSTRMRGF